MTCEFCGIETVKGSNEFGEFACPDCLAQVAEMMPADAMPS